MKKQHQVLNQSILILRGAMSMNQHQKHQKMVQLQFMIKMEQNLISLVMISMMVIKDRKRQ